MGSGQTLTGVYLDASAAVKLLRTQAETSALDRFLSDLPLRVSSEVLRVELACVCHRQQIPRSEADQLLSGLRLLPLSTAILGGACEPFAPPQRALDALHLATALYAREQLECLITYDADQAAAAEACGFTVAHPA